MKKFRSQISIGIICVLLGFMITYQFKMISKQNSATEPNKNSPEIIIENEQLKKQIEETKKKVTELDGKVMEYENAAKGLDQQSQILYKQLEESRNGYSKETCVIAGCNNKALNDLAYCANCAIKKFGIYE